MSNIILIKEYDVPCRASALTADTIEEYFDDIQNFFINRMGLYSCSERQIYNDLLFDCYSDTENGEPCFCFSQLIKNNYTIFGIVPCLYNIAEDKYYPAITTDISWSYFLWFAQYHSTIVFNCGNSNGSDTSQTPYYIGFYPAVKCIYLKDGRKIFFFINQYRGNPLDTNQNYGYKAFNFGGCLYFTNIKCNNQKISNNKKCIIFSDSPNTSYFQEIQGTASQVRGDMIHGKYRYNFIKNRSLINSGGYIPDKIMAKDFLLKIPQFYIGEDYYIEEISFFSDLRTTLNGASSAGKVIEINNREYVILYNQPPYRMNKITNHTSDKFFNLEVSDRGIWTPSLIIPTNSLE